MTPPARAAAAPDRVLAYLRAAWPLAKRDLLARYRGSLAGLAWAVLAPVAMVAIYAGVFRGVFQARWPGAGDDGLSYVLRLFAGLVVFGSVSELATRATRLIQDNANLVKRVVFPLELIVLSLLLQVAVHTALQLAVLALALLALGDGARPGWAALPLAWAWLLLLQWTLALALSALGCYLRDLQHLVPLSITGLLFLSPVFYPVEAAPPVLRAVLLANPLSAPIELFRGAWFGAAVDWGWVAGHGLVLLAAAAAAQVLFRRLRPGFPDLV